MNQSNKVQLYLYDLSQGAARQMSQQFLGIQIDGIWHTGIVIFGKEYYFGGGICQGIPGQTPYGSPIQKIELGDSQVTQEVFHHYLESIRPQYVIETYDLFTHNCNNFSDECSNFLLGQGIPKYITDLPNQVLRTPLGQMIKPMIDGFTNQMNQQSISQSMFPPGQTDLRQNINNEQTQQNNVIDISSFEQFLEILENNKGVVIDFYSLQCPPCLRIKPIFANLANQFKNICPELKFCAVNVTKVKDLASAMEISSIPTFLFYFQCDLTQKMVGANEQQLKQNISDLAAKIGIKQQNNADQLNNQMQQLVLKFQIYDPSKQEFYQFKSGNLDVPIGKILDQLEVAQQKPDYYEIFQEFSQLKSFDKFVDQTKQYKLLVFMIKMINFESDSNFQLVLPSLDILRSFICDQKILKVLIEKHSDFIDTVFESLLCPDRSSSLQKGIKVLMLRFITNLFIDQEGVRYLSLKLDEIQIITDQFINHEFMTLNAITMIVYNMILVQNNLLLDQDYKQQLLEKILQIILNQQVNDDATFIAILYTILNIIYKNKGFIEFMNKYDLSPIKTKLSQSKDEKIGYALKDLKNVLDGKIN